MYDLSFERMSRMMRIRERKKWNSMEFLERIGYAMIGSFIGEQIFYFLNVNHSRNGKKVGWSIFKQLKSTYRGFEANSLIFSFKAILDYLG